MFVLNCNFTLGSCISLQSVGLVKSTNTLQWQTSEQPGLIPGSCQKTSKMLNLHPEAGKYKPFNLVPILVSNSDLNSLRVCYLNSNS